MKRKLTKRFYAEKAALIAAVCCTVTLLACSGKEDKIKALVLENLTQTTESPNDLKVLGISEPDSAYGAGYFSDADRKHILAILKKNNDVIMEKTGNMSFYNSDDAYVTNLVYMQVHASGILHGILSGSLRKGAWSGWKVRADFSARNQYGPYKAERWFLMDKDCRSVFSTFDLPLP
jgi:hypothetical protein